MNTQKNNARNTTQKTYQSKTTTRSSHHGLNQGSDHDGPTPGLAQLMSRIAGASFAKSEAFRLPESLRAVTLGLTLVGALGTTTTSAFAGDRQQVATERFTEYAKVVNVQPIYREVRLSEPREQCWTEQEQHVIGYENGHASTGNQRQQRRRNSHSTNGALVGSLIGGVIGNQLGRGHSSSSRAGATVAGAIIGGAIGNESHAGNTRHRRQENRHRPARPIVETRPVERCKRVVESRYEQRLQYYNVTYRYKGRTFTTQMPRDPGNRIELQVSVRPARY